MSGENFIVTFIIVAIAMTAMLVLGYAVGMDRAHHQECDHLGGMYVHSVCVKGMTIVRRWD